MQLGSFQQLGYKRLLACAAVCLLTLLCSTSTNRLCAQDEGGESSIWVLDFKVKALRMFTPTEGPHKGRVYWYMVYSLENKSDEDREFFLSTNAASDRNKSYGDVYLPAVEKAIEKRFGRKLWGQSDRFAEIKDRDESEPLYNYTTIKAGEKRECVAVFNRLDSGANSIAIEVFGLSNDLEEKEGEDGSKEVSERVRVLDFKRIGDDNEIDQDPLKRVDSRWIRKSVKIDA